MKHIHLNFGNKEIEMTLYFNTAVVKEGGQPTPVEEEPLKVNFFTDPMYGDYGAPMCIIKLSNKATKDMIKAQVETDQSVTFIDGDGQFVWKLWFDNGKWFSPDSDTYELRGNVSTGYWVEYESSYDGNHKEYKGSFDGGIAEKLPNRDSEITPGSAEKLVFQLNPELGYCYIYVPSNNWQHERGTSEWVCDVTWNSDNTFSLSNVVFYSVND